MKYAIMVVSRSGNTNQLAQQIPMVLGEENCVYMGAPKANVEADVLFLGSWTDKGFFDEAILNVMKELHHQKVVLFGTAGFGQSQEYFDAILQRSATHLAKDNEILGCFMCQGKMPLSVRKRYEEMGNKEPDNERLKNLIVNFDQALTHPDEQDMNNFKTFLQGLNLS